MIVKNLIFAVLGQGAEKAISFLVIAVLAHYFSQLEMGQFFLAISITTIVGSFTEIGTSTHLVRAIASDPDEASSRLSEVLFLRIPLVAIAVSSICFCVFIFDPDQLLLYTTVAIYVVGQSSYYAFGSVFVGLQRISDRVFTGLIGPAVLLFAVPLGVWNGMSFRGVLLIYAVSSIMMLAFTAKALSRHINVRLLIPSRKSLKKTLSSALPIFALTFLALIHARIDEIMLAIYRDYEEVAIYAAGYKLLEVSRMAVRPVTMVLLPVLAAAAASRAWFEFRSSASYLVWGSLAAGTVIAITMLLLSPWIVPLAFGDSYGKTITVTQVLFLSAPALFLGHSVILIANSLNMIKGAIVILTCSVLGNALLNALVIPIYGAIGAAWTTLITESMAALGILVVIKVVLRRKVELSGG